MTEGSGSGSGSRRPKNKWIRNTDCRCRAGPAATRCTRRGWPRASRPAIRSRRTWTATNRRVSAGWTLLFTRWCRRQIIKEWGPRIETKLCPRSRKLETKFFGYFFSALNYVLWRNFKLCESCHVNDKNCTFCKIVASFYTFLHSFISAKILNRLFVPTIIILKKSWGNEWGLLKWWDQKELKKEWRRELTQTWAGK